MSAVNHLCTISTVSHLYKTFALADSLKQGEEYTLHVLLVDSDKDYSHENCRFWKLGQLQIDDTIHAITQKYTGSNDRLRWSLKPAFMKYLMANLPTDKMIYLDNDLYFYNDYQFLFDLLDEYSFLLTPHYYRNSPKRNQNWFEANFRVGLYNAGFVGANEDAIDTLQWWADCCLYRCSKNAIRGTFDDQKYLDLVPIMNETAHVVRHMGCNVAGWNSEVCSRQNVNGEILIDGKFPVVFIHYNDTTIREIVKGEDSVLQNHYQHYISNLKKYKNDLSENTLVVNPRLSDKLKYAIWKVVTDKGLL